MQWRARKHAARHQGARLAGMHMLNMAPARLSPQVTTPCMHMLTTAPARLSLQVTMRLTIKAGYDLLAADRGGTSDPDVSWQIGSESGKTRAARKTLNPVWNETVEVWGEARDFASKPIRLECFDHDLLSSDDSLGTTVLPPEAIRAVLIQTLKGEEPDEGRLFWLPLNGKGYVERH